MKKLFKRNVFAFIVLVLLLVCQIHTFAVSSVENVSGESTIENTEKDIILPEVNKILYTTQMFEIYDKFRNNFKFYYCDYDKGYKEVVERSGSFDELTDSVFPSDYLFSYLDYFLTPPVLFKIDIIGNESIYFSGLDLGIEFAKLQGETKLGGWYGNYWEFKEP